MEFYKPIQYNEEKRKQIKEKHRVDLVDVCKKGIFLQYIPQHNPDKYPRQQAYIVAYDGYPVFIPFVEENDYIFIKNCIPKREYKHLLQGE